MARAVKTRVALVPLDRLRPAPWNPRLIADARFENLCRSIETDPEFLWQRPILATADGTIYGGNMRFRAVEALGWVEVPAVIEDIPERLAKERALRDNGQWGEWSEDALSVLLSGLAEEGADVSLLGFEDAEVKRLLASLAGPGEDPGGEIDRADELLRKWKVETGQLWGIPSAAGKGEHRLLCGDSTSEATVSRLLDDARAEMVWTDPPYGVAIGEKNHFLNAVGPSNRVEGAMQGDRGMEDLRALLAAAFDHACRYCAPGASWYVAAPAAPLPHCVYTQVLSARGLWRTTLGVGEELQPVGLSGRGLPGEIRDHLLRLAPQRPAQILRWS